MTWLVLSPRPSAGRLAPSRPVRPMDRLGGAVRRAPPRDPRPDLQTEDARRPRRSIGFRAHTALIGPSSVWPRPATDQSRPPRRPPVQDTPRPSRTHHRLSMLTHRQGAGGWGLRLGGTSRRVGSDIGVMSREVDRFRMLPPPADRNAPPEPTCARARGGDQDRRVLPLLTSEGRLGCRPLRPRSSCRHGRSERCPIRRARSRNHSVGIAEFGQLHIPGVGAFTVACRPIFRVLLRTTASYMASASTRPSARRSPHRQRVCQPHPLRRRGQGRQDRRIASRLPRPPLDNEARPECSHDIFDGHLGAYHDRTPHRHCLGHRAPNSRRPTPARIHRSAEGVPVSRAADDSGNETRSAMPALAITASNRRR